MNAIKAVLFDLDGTLLNTLADLADSVNFVLKKHGFPTHPIDAYRYFVGNGMEKLVIRSLPEDRRTSAIIEQCKSDFLSHYAHNWNHLTAVYPGIADLLDQLREKDIKLAVLSNKPDEMTKKCVSLYLNSWNFDAVAGQLPEIPAKPDPAGVFRIIDMLNLTHDECLYVGDSSVDMKTATAAHMFAVGVTWGFRPREELVAHGAQTIVDHPMDILRVIAEVTSPSRIE